MSTVTPEADADDEEPGAALAARSGGAWARGLAFLLLSLSLLALFRSEAAHVRDDLVVLAPEEALAGSNIPLRAFVLRDVEAMAGPVLGNARIHAQIGTLSGEVLSRASAQGSAALGLRAVLSLPAHARGTLRIDVWEARGAAGADAGPEGALLRVSRALTVVGRVRPRTLYRDALPLQRGALGRIRREGEHPPPSAFLPRVLGGVCVPEELCTLAVWVGEPAALVTLEPGNGVELVRDFPALADAGLVTAVVRVHGPEAELTLRARREGNLVASRGLRLPVALGRALVGPLSEEPGARTLSTELTLPPGRGRGIADLFVDDAWIASQDVLDPRARVSFVLPPGPGSVRVQVRVDPFGADGAASRLTYVGGDLPTAVRALTAERQADATDGWLTSIPAEVTRDPALLLGFVAAPQEEAALDLGTSVSARPMAAAALNAGKLRVRWAAALALACGALLAAAGLVRRGMVAQREAASVMAQADWVDDSRTRQRAQLEVWLWALAVALAFAAAALLIVAKPLWF